MQPSEIVSGAMHDLREDTTYTRIATATQFIHSLIFNILIIYYLIAFSSVLSEQTVLGKLVHTYLQLIQFDTNTFVWLLIIGIFLLIGYELLPPIGTAAMIYYLDDKDKKDGFRAIAKGLYKFFPMFEYGLATSLFKASFIVLVLLRLFLFGLVDNWLIMTMMFIRAIICFCVALFLPYSQFIICLQGEHFFDAMKKSVSITVNNMGITIRFVIINAILSVRFLLNILIMIGIPLGMIWLGAWLELQNYAFLNRLFLIVLIGLVFVATYIEGIIEGFFTAARHRIYKSVTTTPPTDTP